MSVFSNDLLETIEAIAPNENFLGELVVIVGDASTYREQDDQRLKPTKKTERALRDLVIAVRKSHEILQGQWEKLEHEDKHLSEELAGYFPEEWDPSSLSLIADSIEWFAEYVGDSKIKGGPHPKYVGMRVARRVAEVFQQHQLKVVCTAESEFVVVLDCVLRAGEIDGNARSIAEKLVKLLRYPT